MLAAEPAGNLAGNIPAELSAGTGLVYASVLHRGQNYSPSRPRSTVHLGYHSTPALAATDALGQHHSWLWQPEARAALSARACGALEAAATAELVEYNLQRAVLAAAVEGDRIGFCAGVRRLVGIKDPPGPAQSTDEEEVPLIRHMLVTLCVLARQIKEADALRPVGIGGASRPTDRMMPFLQLGTKQFLAADFSSSSSSASATSASSSAVAQGPDAARRLWARFAGLDQRLLRGGDTARPHHVRSFLGPPTMYEYERLPGSAPFDLESVVAQWGNQARL